MSSMTYCTWWTLFVFRLKSYCLSARRIHWKKKILWPPRQPPCLSTFFLPSSPKYFRWCRSLEYPGSSFMEWFCGITCRVWDSVFIQKYTRPPLRKELCGWQHMWLYNLYWALSVPPQMCKISMSLTLIYPSIITDPDSWTVHKWCLIKGEDTYGFQ